MKTTPPYCTTRFTRKCSSTRTETSWSGRRKKSSSSRNRWM